MVANASLAMSPLMAPQQTPCLGRGRTDGCAGRHWCNALTAVRSALERVSLFLPWSKAACWSHRRRRRSGLRLIVCCIGVGSNSRLPCRPRSAKRMPFATSPLLLPVSPFPHESRLVNIARECSAPAGLVSPIFDRCNEVFHADTHSTACSYLQGPAYRPISRQF